LSKLIVIAGATGSGKDTLMESIIEHMPKIKKSISYTTRPMRPGEQDGREYYFCDELYYKKMESQGLILSGRTYFTIQDGINAVWHYGLPFLKEELTITILDHKGAKRVINKLGRENVFVINVDASNECLIERCVKSRGDEEAEVRRRIADDRIQFEGIKKITDLYFNTEEQKQAEVLVDSLGGILKWIKFD